MDYDYYTWGGFQTIVDTFTRLAYFTNNVNFLSLVGILMGLGVIFNLVYQYAGAAHEGKNPGNISYQWLPQLAIATVIVAGLIVPKGTLHIYDKLSNQYQAVSDIPALIVNLAGLGNQLEQGIVSSAQSSSAYPYNDTAGGVGIGLVYSSLIYKNLTTNYQLDKSLYNYIDNCVLVTIQDDQKFGDLKQHKANQLEFLEFFRNKVARTTYYGAGHVYGKTDSCWNIWDNHLKADLQAESFETAIFSICKQNHFKSSSELARCKQLLETGANNVFALDQNSRGSMTSQNLLLNKYLANNIWQAIQDNRMESISRLVNFSTTLDGMGTGIAAQEWTYILKSVLTSAVYAVIALLLCFMATPWWQKALKTIFGLVFFVVTWGVIDAFFHQSTIDSALALLENVRDTGISVENLLFASPELAKALAMMGKNRSMSILIAIFVSGTLTGVSSYAFAQAGSAWQGSIDQKGEEAANKAMNPAMRGQILQGAVAGAGYEQAANHYGGENMLDAQTFRTAEDQASFEHFRANSAMAESEMKGAAMLHGANSSIAMAERTGTIAGASKAGQLEGTESAANQLNQSVEETAANTSYSAAMNSNLSAGLLKRMGDLYPGGYDQYLHDNQQFSTSMANASFRTFMHMADQFGGVDATALSKAGAGWSLALNENQIDDFVAKENKTPVEQALANYIQGKDSVQLNFAAGHEGNILTAQAKDGVAAITDDGQYISAGIKTSDVDLANLLANKDNGRIAEMIGKVTDNDGNTIDAKEAALLKTFTGVLNTQASNTVSSSEGLSNQDIDNSSTEVQGGLNTRNSVLGSAANWLFGASANVQHLVSDNDSETRSENTNQNINTDANYAAVKEIYTSSELQAQENALQQAQSSDDWYSLNETQQQERIETIQNSLHASYFTDGMNDKLQEQIQLQQDTIAKQGKDFADSKSPIDDALDYFKK